VGTGQVGGDLCDRPLLGSGERKGQRGVEPPHQLPVDSVAEPLGLPFDGPLPNDQRQLQAEQLVDHETATGRVRGRQRLRVVDVIEGPRAVNDVEAIPPLGRKGIGELAGPAQRLLHPEIGRAHV
jgi:hypothetical protein